MKVEQVLELVKAVSDSELTEFKYEEDGVKLSLKKTSDKIIQVQAPAAPAAAPVIAPAVMPAAAPAPVPAAAPVSAPADARIMESGTDEEIGNYLVLDLGDGYTVTCGQMKEVQAAVGEYLEKGQVLGYVAEPTKYYTLEGPNIYLKLEKDGTAVDPLDYLE